MGTDKIKVLYIEDDEDSIQLVTMQLATSKDPAFEVTVIKDIKTFIKMSKDECDESNIKYDIILLDLNLPNSHGIDTFTRVISKCKILPVVIISGHADIAYKCVTLGAQDYLVKPVSAYLLIRSLLYAIERKLLENKLKRVIDSSPLGYHFWEYKNEKLYLTGYNQAAEEISNVPHEQLLNRELTELFPNVTPDVVAGYKKVVITGKPWKNQIIPYGNDVIGFGFFKTNAYKSSDTQLTVIFEDVTSSVVKDQKLRESEERYRRLVEIAGVAVFGIRFSDNKLTYANQTFYDYIGYTEEEFSNLSFTDILTDEGLILFRQRTLALKRGENIPGNIEYPIKRKDGTVLWAFVTTDYLQNSNGNVVGVNAVAIDITQKKIEEEEKKKIINQTYTNLEIEIKKWNEELTESYNETNKKLELLDNEIFSLTLTHKKS